MKLRNKIAALILLVITVCSVSACSVLDAATIAGADDGNNGYVTKDDVNKLIEGIEENVVVNSGDNYNININSDGNQNSVSAAKGLLSTVSIEASFTVTTVTPPSFFYPGSTDTSEQTSRGSGIIYKLDKDKGDAYIVTNYHVVYSKGADTDNDISDDIKCYLYGQDYLWR